MDVSNKQPKDSQDSYQQKNIQSSVEIYPQDVIIFEYQPSKKLIGRIELRNNWGNEKVFRILTTQPTQYKIQPSNGLLKIIDKVDIFIGVLCEESRLEHRLNDRFKVQIMDKPKYEQMYDEKDKWKELLVDKQLKISLIRLENFQSSILTSNTMKRSMLKKTSVKSQILQSEKIGQIGNLAQMSIHSVIEDQPLKRKYESLLHKFEEQKSLIVLLIFNKQEQYKYDINELQNQIDRHSFIYDQDSLQNKMRETDNLILAIRDKTGIPLWELFFVATIALILGAVLNRQ